MPQQLGKPLTQREKQILDLIMDGESGRSAAKRAHLSPNTVQTYLARIKVKLGAKSTTHAAVIYMRALEPADREYQSWGRA